MLSAVQDSMMQRFLHDAGYWTGLVGKFLNNWPNQRDPVHFDRWKTTPFIDFSGAAWNVNGSIRWIEQNSTSYIGGRAVRFIRGSEQRDRRPWFLHVGFMAPHLPATVEPRYHSARVPPLHLSKAMRERDRTDKPPFVRERPLATKELIARRLARQLRSLIAVDDQVERIMSTLERFGEAEHTLAIFVSDNGYLWGEHGLFQKSTPYQPSARIPMAMTWPGRVARGATDDRLSAIIDLAPTILSAARVRPPSVLDGMNLFDRSVTRWRLLLEFRQVERSRVPSWSAFITKRKMYAEYREPGGDTVFREFYRTRSDPQQLVNVLQDGVGTNDPNVGQLSDTLHGLEACSGRSCLR